jgi:VanZ like family/Concanavalin A-like lectin/glucanases superfamily
MLLRLACVFVLLGILVAGLWPFHAPRNEVVWLRNATGIRFGERGSVVSEGEFKNVASSADDSCSIEIWLQPDRVRTSGTILGFFRSEDRSTPFTLRQSLGDLTLESETLRPLLGASRNKIYLDDVLSEPKLVMVTLTSNQAGISVYLDGTLRMSLAKFRFSSHDLTGRLVLGNSPITTHEWSGQIRGLAIYNRTLAAGEVSQHNVSWAKGDINDLAAGGQALAVYAFNEQAGNLIHNRVDSSTDLLIPDRFFVLHAPLLERPWREFSNDWGYWQDVIVNVGGFIPFGLLFYAYFLLDRRSQYPAAIAILIGFLTSLTIEVSQAFLPTRDSGMTDLITNTLGTAIGVGIFRIDFVQRLLKMFGLLNQKHDALPGVADADYEMAANGASLSKP